MGKHCLARLGLSLCLLATWLLGNAVETRDQDQPIHIEADSVELDELQARSLYTGNVVVEQGTMRIEADRVIVRHRSDHRPEHVTAVGEPARYRHQAPGQSQVSRARALRMEYDVVKEEITLIDQAVLVQGNDRFSSDRIVYDRANARVSAGTSAAGSERVKITITPEPQ